MESKIFIHMDTSEPSGADGPMAGTSVAIDPNIAVKEWPTTARSNALEGYVALEDAALVHQLRKSGATLKGRTSMGELGLGLYRDTAGKAVAEGLVDLVFKTDTTGEVRMAASNSGCFGFKPSFGLISRSGIIGLVPSMESCGMVAKNLKTIQTALEYVTGCDTDPLDTSINKAGIEKVHRNFQPGEDLSTRSITIGILREQDKADSVDGQALAQQALVEKLSKAGIKIQGFAIKNLDLAPTLHNIIGSVEASSSAGRFDSVRYGHRSSAPTKNWNDMYINSRNEAFGLLVKSYLFQGGYFQYQNYGTFADACRSRASLVKEVDDILDTVDMIIMPQAAHSSPLSTLEEPKSVADLYDAFAWTVLANLTGAPAIFIPGAPGIQLLGQRFGDAGLLSLGARISDILKGEN